MTEWRNLLAHGKVAICFNTEERLYHKIMLPVWYNRSLSFYNNNWCTLQNFYYHQNNNYSMNHESFLNTWFTSGNSSWLKHQLCLKPLSIWEKQKKVQRIKTAKKRNSIMMVMGIVSFIIAWQVWYQLDVRSKSSDTIECYWCQHLDSSWITVITSQSVPL